MAYMYGSKKAIGYSTPLIGLVWFSTPPVRYHWLQRKKISN